MPRWLRRLRNSNPLLRTSDRIEVLAVVIAVVIALLALPIAGAIGTAVYDSGRHDVTQAAAPQQPVSIPDGEQAAQRQLVADESAGATQTSGTDAERPALLAEASPSIVSKAVVSALVTWAGVAAIAAAANLITRAACARTRSRHWQRSLDQLISDQETRSN